MFSPACNHELPPHPALRSSVQSFVCPQTRKCYSDWFILLWGVSKKETRTSLPVPVLPGVAGTRPGGPILCFPSPVSSWQRAAPGRPSILLHPGSSPATWVGQERLAQGTLLPTVQGRGVGPFILDEEKRGFPTQLTRGLHLAVIKLCSADGKLGWDPSWFLVSILGWNLEKQLVKN